MQAPISATLLRVFIGENDRHGSKPLYEAIVLKAREAHLAGATLVLGIVYWLLRERDDQSPVSAPRHDIAPPR